VRNFFELFERHAAAIGRSNESANAGASDKADGNAFFFEDLEDSDMGHTAGKAAAQRYTQGWNFGLRRGFAGELPPKGLHGPDNLFKTFHRSPHMPERRAPTGFNQHFNLLP
jgi:hypothetical protein